MRLPAMSPSLTCKVHEPFLWWGSVFRRERGSGAAAEPTFGAGILTRSLYKLRLAKSGGLESSLLRAGLTQARKPTTCLVQSGPRAHPKKSPIARRILVMFSSNCGFSCVAAQAICTQDCMGG